MTIVIENYVVPEKGPVEFKINLSFEIKVTAEEARRKVDHRLMDQVSYLMGADPPTLVVGERIVWRVPAYIGFPSAGRVGGVGNVEVDVTTGDMGDLGECKAAILRYLEDEVRPHLPPFQAREDRMSREASLPLEGSRVQVAEVSEGIKEPALAKP